MAHHITAMKKILCLLAFLPFALHAQTIITIAGSHIRGYSGDGGQATAASLNQPGGVTYDHIGNMYISDDVNNVIRKVSPAGIITTMAGNDTAGYSGDNGPATNAKLNHPAKIGIDAANNLYIADSWNHRIRKVDTAGIITTVAGTGFPVCSGDGGMATAANLADPEAVIFDNTGNMYIADAGNKVVRKVATTGIITTYAGHCGSTSVSGDGGLATLAGLGSVQALAFDSAQNLYIADGNARIRIVSAAGIIGTFAGSGGVGSSGDGGPATAAGFDGLSAIAVDASGNVYTAESNSSVVRKINPTGIINRIAGIHDAFAFAGDGGAALLAKLNSPAELAIDPNGDLVICDQGNNRIRKIYSCPASVTTSPVSTTVDSGTVAHFFAGSTALFATYQWQVLLGSNYTNLPNAAPYLGVATNTLTILNATAAMNGSYYKCIISKSAMCHDTTSSAILQLTSSSGGGNPDTTVNVACVSTPKGVSIFPNPAQNYADITIEGNAAATIQLYNSVGQLVITQQTRGYARISLGNLPTGIYMLKVVEGGKSSVHRLLKN